jgi:hypothetical protein
MMCTARPSCTTGDTAIHGENGAHFVVSRCQHGYARFHVIVGGLVCGRHGAGRGVCALVAEVGRDIVPHRALVGRRVAACRRDAVTSRILRARPLANMVRPASAKRRDCMLQRPCSTQDTGSCTVVPAATSTVRLMIRFCFAPITSSPSSRRTGRTPSFTARGCPTERAAGPGMKGSADRWDVDYPFWNPGRG